MELKIRENKNGPYVIIHSNDFKEGINFAKNNSLNQIQLRGAIGSDQQLVDFALLGQLSENLKVLSISGFNDKITKVENVDSLYDLNNLEILSIQEKLNFKLDISRFVGLIELGVMFSNSILNLTNATQLKILVISSAFPDENLHNLKPLEALSKLHIYKSNKLSNIHGVEQLTNLKELKLAFNSGVENIEAINDSTIEKLYIEKCKNLTNFSDLNGNNTISDLLVSEVESLEFVKTMTNLEKINFWDCKDGDLNSLLKSETLKYINFYPNKKHYSHTLEEIKKLKGLDS